jgi:hypothetical protein
VLAALSQDKRLGQAALPIEPIVGAGREVLDGVFGKKLRTDMLSGALIG